MSHNLVIYFAKYLIVAPLAISAVYWLLKLDKPQKLRYVALLVLGGTLSIIFAKLATSLYLDPRPFIRDGVVPYFKSATDNGFPSDHTLLSALFAAVMWPFNRRLSMLLYVMAVAVGSARVISGVHHGIDIIGGLALASLAVLLAWLIIGKLLPGPKSQV
jgi:membrane-associated phospholipid phosphatase